MRDFEDLLDDIIEPIMGIVITLAFILSLLYLVVGTSGNIDDIQRLAIRELPERGWTIIRKDEATRGRIGKHGGSVWYYVKDNSCENTNYRVGVSMRGGELQYDYKVPDRCYNTK
jgi:hypothetical protein